MTLIVILTACLLWQGSILMVIRQRLKAPHHDSDPTPSVYASLFLDLPVVWVSLVQPCLLCRTNACKLHCALWEHVPRVLTPHKHPPQELLFEEFTPTTLIQFVNLYLTQTDIKKWSNVSTQWRLNWTKLSRPHSFIIHVTVTAADVTSTALSGKQKWNTDISEKTIEKQPLTNWRDNSKGRWDPFVLSRQNCYPINLRLQPFLENKHKPFTLMILFLFSRGK